MNIEEEILKLYQLANKNFQMLNDVAEQMNLVVSAINEVVTKIPESIQKSSNTSVQILAVVQVLREEVLSLAKRFPE